MVPLTMLWLPILVSAVIVFIASSIIWMALPIHKNDYKKLANENAVADAMGSVPAGQYMFPYSGGGQMTPEIKERFEKGPAGIMIIREPGPFSMGTQLVTWFIYCLVISLFVAYLTGRTLGAGHDYLEVFRVAGTAAVLGYAGAAAPNAIWFSKPWSVVVKDIVDGVVYGLLTAGVFGWLWPQ